MKQQILVVDDSSSDIELLLIVLESIAPSLDVYIAHDGQEALDFLLPSADAGGDAAPRFSLILLDIKMPKVDGLEVLSALKASSRSRGIPVVMFTSSSEERDVEQAYELGANGYVVKPVDFQEYQDLLRSIITFWLHANCRPGSRERKVHPGVPAVMTVYECRTGARRAGGNGGAPV